MTLRCSIDTNIVTPCDSLSKVINHVNPLSKAKGIKVLEIHNAKRLTKRLIYAIGSDVEASSGIVFNFCPYCGERIAHGG